MEPQPFRSDNPLPTGSLPARLMNRARMMNRIHEALRSTLNQSDLYSILAAILVSPRGMGFSRGIILKFDSVEERFEPCASYGMLDREAHDRVRTELEEEEALDRAVSHPEGLELEWIDEAALFYQSHDETHSGAFWATLAAKFHGRNPLFDQMRSLSWGLKIPEIGSSTETGRDFFPRLLKAKSSLLVTRREMEQSSVPLALKKILQGDSLWANIGTSKGGRLILIADKQFEPLPLDDIDQLHMDWFCNQAAITLEKADLFAELKESNESLKALDTLKTNFLSTVSHELRSPLTAITGFSRLLANGQVGEISARQSEILNRVLHHAERLTNIINDLIEIVEIDTGIAVEVNLQAVDPLNILMETLPKLEPRRVSKSAEIEPVVPTTVPLIRADEKRLSRILYHLIDNAIKFGKDKGKTKVEFIPKDGELSIHIADSGIGIPPEKLAKIFDSFYQVDNQLTRVYEGMGIGLTLTNKLVKGTGGRITVKSQVNEGTTFTLTYPLY